MIRRLLRDPIAIAVSLIWLAMAALYFLPGVPRDLLELLGDRYSTLPLWALAGVACLAGLDRTADAEAKRVWRLQAASFAALIAIELPWALALATDTPAWNIAAEVTYFAYYLYQLTSATTTRAGVVRAGVVCALFAIALSALTIVAAPVYDTGRPSYFTYMLFDTAMAFAFWRLRRRSRDAWPMVFTGLALASTLVFALDVLDWLSYEKILNLRAGMRTDILWMLPPLCYALIARASHLGGAVARLGKTL